MSEYTILIADDDEMIVDVLQRELKREGYATLICYDGEAALELAHTEYPDLILLDVMMPKRNGWEVCRELRAESTVPILMLTARGEEMDRVMGLKLGADDYIVKSFGLLELLARVDENLRRAAMTEERVATAAQSNVPIDHSHVTTLANLVIDLGRHTVMRNGTLVDLAHKEFELLATLLAANGAVIERSDLLDQVWGEGWFGDSRTLDVHIRRLRNKLEEDDASPRLLLTVRGVGYRLVSPSEVSE